MKKSMCLYLLTAILLPGLLLMLLFTALPRSHALETFISRETEVSETAPAFSWELDPPENIPAGEKRAAVIYRPVHETVYCVSPLYVRAGPGSEYSILGRLSQGELVRRGAIGNNGWSQILYGDQEAYVNSTYLSVTPITPTADPFGAGGVPRDEILYSTIVTKLRSGPGPDHAVVGHLTQGTGARRVAMGENGWSRIIFHDTEVYACTAALTCSDSTYEETEETLFCLSPVSILSGPGFQYPSLGLLNRGEAVTRTAAGISGWSRIRLGDRQAWVPTGYLSPEPAPEAPAIVTSEAELPTPNSPFVYQYMAPENIMPHAVFTPMHADLSRPLPLIISLHGALEIGEAPETLKSNFITKELRNWEYTGLEGFDAYVICPQMTGCGYAETWRCPESADNLFHLIDYLTHTYYIDMDHIILEGHSLGGQGALYMAADPRACFSAVVPVSAYSPDVSCSGITAAVRGYTGSPYIPAPREDWDSFNFMKKVFREDFGSQNWFMKNCSHYDIPMVAFEEDLDGNGRSDLIEWMLSPRP